MNDSITLVINDEQHVLGLGESLTYEVISEDGTVSDLATVTYEERDGERGLAFCAADGWTMTTNGEGEVEFEPVEAVEAVA